MIYTYESGYVHEYEVQVNREQLIKVRGEILENCSIIISYAIKVDNDTADKIEKSTDTSINRVNNTLISNEMLQYFSRTHKIYNYDEYIYPEIINIIDEILDYDYTRFNEMFEISDLTDCPREYFAAEIKKLCDEYLKTKDKKLLSKVKELIDRLMCDEIESPKEEIRKYYGAIQECFILKMVNSYNTDELSNLQKTYGSNWYEEIIEKLNVLKTLHEKIDNSVNSQFIKRINEINGKKK